MGVELGMSCAHVSMALTGVGLMVLDFTADNHASNINARTLYTLSRQRQLHGMPVDPIPLLKQVCAAVTPQVCIVEYFMTVLECCATGIRAIEDSCSGFQEKGRPDRE